MIVRWRDHVFDAFDTLHSCLQQCVHKFPIYIYIYQDVPPRTTQGRGSETKNRIAVFLTTPTAINTPAWTFYVAVTQARRAIG